MNFGFNPRQPQSLVFGVGNWMYPRARDSIAVQIINRVATRANSVWYRDEMALCNITDTTKALLATSTSYIIDQNYRSVPKVLKYRNIDINKLTIVTFSDRPFGHVVSSSGISHADHKILTSISAALKSDEYRVVEVGVNRPPDSGYNYNVLGSLKISLDKFEKLATTTKFSDEEQLAIDYYILPWTEKIMFSTDNDLSYEYDYPQMMRLVREVLAKKNTVKKLRTPSNFSKRLFSNY